MISANNLLGDLDAFTRNLSDATLVVTDDIVGLRTIMVNVYFVDITGTDDTRKWVLIDTGLPVSGHAIRATAERLYGEGARPECILLTHGHFDHVGTVQAFADEWNVPVYAHPLEMPYLTGRASYAPPDPWVGGFMPLTSPLFSRGPIDLGDRVHPLPEDGSVPHLDGWRWIHTPGHSPGHVSFFRDSDRVLIAGDAFVTTKQESLLSVITQAQGVFGPPAYFTHNFEQAEESVKKLAALNPLVAATGHGTPMAGERLQRQLNLLAVNFRRLAVPENGRYTDHPVDYDENGPEAIPPAKPIPTGFYVAAGTAATVGLLGLGLLNRARKS